MNGASWWMSSGTGPSQSLWAAVPWNALLQSWLAWGVLAGAVALLLMMPGSTRGLRRAGTVVGGLALLLFAAGMVRLEPLGSQLTFTALALLTVGAAAAAIAMRSAVYSAIWFAVSLLGTGGLFCLQSAQFLGVATVVVYAGAIVVTLLFVVMLAQPEGHDTYDRISWGPLAKPAVILTVALLLGTLLGAIAPLRDEAPPARGAATGTQALDALDGRSHMARLGGVLFSRHLVAVEVGGTLLLAALVGAVAIVIQGRDSERRPSAGDDERGGDDHG